MRRLHWCPIPPACCSDLRALVVQDIDETTGRASDLATLCVRCDLPTDRSAQTAALAALKEPAR
jgi:hypothetical protein